MQKDDIGQACTMCGTKSGKFTGKHEGNRPVGRPRRYYDKGYQQMPLSFVIFLYLYVSTLHVSGLYQPIIRGIPSCCLFVTTWFM